MIAGDARQSVLAQALELASFHTNAMQLESFRKNLLLGRIALRSNLRAFRNSVGFPDSTEAGDRAVGDRVA